jgi:hypothetical protein
MPTGKDRTGWAAAAFLTLLGVPKDVVMQDFLRSNDYILPNYKQTIDTFVEAAGDREFPMALNGFVAVHSVVHRHSYTRSCSGFTTDQPIKKP